MKRLIFGIVVAFCAVAVQAGDIYVSLENGKNKNAGTKEAPLKNLWKALANAEHGDTIHLTGGVYPGQMKCNWFKIDKAVSIIGGYAPDFSSRDPLKYQTLFQPLNDNNDKKGTGLGIFTIEFDHTKPEPQGINMVFDGLIFDDGMAQSYHPTKGKPEGVETGMWLEPPAKGNTPFASSKRYLVYSATANRATGDITFKNCACDPAEIVPLNVYVARRDGSTFAADLKLNLRADNGYAVLGACKLKVKKGDEITEKTIETPEQAKQAALEYFGIPDLPVRDL